MCHVASIYAVRVYRFGLVLLRIDFRDRGFVSFAIAIGSGCQSVWMKKKNNNNNGIKIHLGDNGLLPFPKKMKQRDFFLLVSHQSTNVGKKHTQMKKIEM